MPFINHLSLLALASTVFAKPHAAHQHGNVHRHAPASYGSDAAAYPYPHANGTAVWGSTGISPPVAQPTGQASSSSAIYQSLASSSSIANAVPTGAGSEISPADASPPSYGPGGSNVSPAGASPPSYGSGASEASPAGAGGNGGAESCAVVTVTETQKVTATVTAGQPAMSSDSSIVPAGSSAVHSSQVAPSAPVSIPAPSSISSSEASPVGTSSAPAPPPYSAPAPVPAPSSSSSSKVSPVGTSSAPIAPGYGASSSSSAPPAPASSSSVASPVTTSAVPSYKGQEPSSSSTAAPAVSSYVLPGKGADGDMASSSSSAPASTPSPGTSSSGKRGLAYNDASLMDCFSGGREISWAYNWGSSSDGLKGDYNFVPTLWGTSSEFTGPWSKNAKSAISSGSTHLFSFNEPDHTAQANLSPEAAAAAYVEHMNPFKGQAQLCAPSVTNGGDNMGLNWLKSFMECCTDCHIDCVNIHWYDSAENVEYFKKHVQDAIAMANGKPVYVSEFGASGSDDQINKFLQEVMPWMDSNSNVAGYAYFMVKEGLLVSGSEPSSYGTTYKSYTS